MPEEIKSLIYYPIHYHVTYDVVKKNGFNVDGERWANDAKKTFARLDLDPSEEMNAITLGCGNGKVDESIINTLLEKYSKIRYTAVDPLPDELGKFEKMAKDNEKKWQNVKFDFQATTVEEYLEKEKNKTFGLIVISQSAYHFNDIEGTLAQLYNDNLVKGGMFFIKMVAGGWEKVFLKIGEYYCDPKFHFLGSETVKNMLKRRIPDIKLEVVGRDNLVDVTECFDEKSQDGGYMLECLTQVHDFRNFCKPEIKKAFMEYFRDECCNKDGDKFFLRAGEADLIAFKQ
ncbi:histamine N-methyltransferase-like [Saccoglossus kowalevskii]|uniref:Uncharacterized protein LOC100373828 n=1 Tax=Saccoglossus kowalevskii TaxID=10224 RepID=A0ABM0GWB7_SACKO|nr:PREDICTED: uncharacterized protein LOC100373828 [Saccoglossus kowalevskii]